MSEPVTPETQPEAPEAPAAAPEQNEKDLPQWARDAITKANREAAKHRTEVAALKPMADQFRQLEEASKSEMQRLQEAAEATKADLERTRADAVRYKAAATYKIDAEYHDLLGSGSEDEVSARAEKIAALLAAKAATPPAPAPGKRPVEQLRPGATPGEAENEDDVLMAQLFGPGH